LVVGAMMAIAPRVLQQPADVIQPELAETGIAVTANSALLPFHRLWCTCIPLPLSANSAWA